MKRNLLVAFVLTILVIAARGESSPVLRSLPADVQKNVDDIRSSCREAGSITTAGDEGLMMFTVSKAQAVLIDDLNFCSNGQCIHGINCATGFSHNVAVYVRHGNAWTKSFSADATEPIFLSSEPDTEQFRALVLSVHGGGDLGCPQRNKGDPTAWKHEKCDFVVKWDGTKFDYRPL
jgi:hypothetical protein